MIRCYKCKGKGYVRGKVDLFMAVFTVGMSALMDKSETSKCTACDGKGYLKDE